MTPLSSCESGRSRRAISKAPALRPTATLRSVTFMWLLALTVAVTSATAQTGEPDPRTRAKMKEVQAELDVESKKLDAANLALQDLYETLEKTYNRAASGQASELIDELERVLDGPFVEAAKVADNPGKVSSTIEKGLGGALKQLENSFLVTVNPLLRQAAIGAAKANAEGLADFSVRDFAIATAREAFKGDVDFSRVWNEHIADRRPEAKAYGTQREIVDRLREKLLVLEDPKMAFTVGAPDGMARIPAGSYLVASKYGFSKKKRRKARVKSFFIDLYEVTHGDYWRNFYVKLTDAREKESLLPRADDGRYLWFQDDTTGEYQPLPEMMLLPVVGIDCAAAAAYAKAQGKRLPTEAEWLAAASGSPKELTLYSWGEKYAGGFCNDKKASREAAVAVSEYKAGRSYFGLYNTCGNVKEWTATTAEGKDFRDDVPANVNITIRGGSFQELEKNVSLLWRWELPGENTRLEDLGFRCARDIIVREKR